MAEAKAARVVKKVLLRPHITQVDFEMVEPAEIQYAAGQYIILHTAEENGKIIKRSYSISSPPSARTFSLCVKIVGTASKFVADLKSGDPVRFSGPWGAGKFTFPAETENEIVMAASGTGLSPVYSLLTSHVPAHPQKKFLLLWGNKKEGDVYYLKELEDLSRAWPNFSFRIFVEEAGPGWTGGRGVLSEIFPRDIGDPKGKEYFLAGNGAMIAAVESRLKAHGVPPARIHKEVFFIPLQS